MALCSFVAGRHATFESESDSNSMDDVEPDSDVDKDYDSDKDPAWKPHVSSHANTMATTHVCAACRLTSMLMILYSRMVFCFGA